MDASLTSKQIRQKFIGKEAGVVDTIALDVHTIKELKRKEFQATEDQPLQKKPKIGKKCQHKPKKAVKCSRCDYLQAAEYITKVKHCDICEMDFQTTAKTFLHIIYDHLDVAAGLKDGNKRCVF